MVKAEGGRGIMKATKNTKRKQMIKSKEGKSPAKEKGVLKPKKVSKPLKRDFLMSKF